MLALVSGCASPIKREVGIYMKQENWNKTREILETAKGRNGRDGEVLILLARTYGELGEYEKMNQILHDPVLKGYSYQKQVNYLTEKHWRQNFNSAVSWAEKKDNPKAAACLKNAILIDPQKPEPYRLLGDLCVQLQTPNEAIDAYRKYVELDKKDWVSCNNLAELLYRAGKFDESVVYSQETFRRDPTQMPAEMRIAYCRMELNQKEEAERAFESAMQLGVTVELCEEYGKLCLSNKKFQQAKSLFTKAVYRLLADPKNCNRFYKYLAECCWGLEDYQNVAFYYEKYLLESQNDEDALKSLLIAYDRTDDKENFLRIKKLLDQIN